MCVVLACRHIPLVTGQHDAACTFQMVGSRSLMCQVPIVIMSGSFVIAVHSGGSILPASGYLPADDRSREGGAPGQSCLQPRKREREREREGFYSRPVDFIRVQCLACLRFFPSLLSSWFLLWEGCPPHSAGCVVAIAVRRVQSSCQGHLSSRPRVFSVYQSLMRAPPTPRLTPCPLS